MNLRFVYRYILSLSKKIKTKQNETKQTDETKGKKSLLRRAGVEPRIFKVLGQLVCQYAPRQLTLNKSVKIFCP